MRVFPRGTRTGHFELLEPLSGGGMGVVYRARDTRLDREVALKHPRRGLVEDPRVRERFRREARAASQLQHPNIVTVFEVFEDQGLDWIAMELVEGESLRRKLEREGALPVGTILSFAVGLADALRAAHARRVLHRDISPGNVLCDAGGRARLADFGLALAYLEPGSDEFGSRSTAITGRHEIVGTLAYMAPEQALGEPLDPRADLFSLGAVLYEMCTGRPAFGGRSRGEVTDALLHLTPASIGRLNPKIPEELERIVFKCLAKRRDERYQDAADLLADLRAEARRVDSESWVSGHLPPSSRRRRRGAWLAVAGAATAVAVWLVVIESPGRAPALPNGKPRQITAGEAWEADVAISPDGQFLAYSSNAAGNADIWLLDIGGGNPIQLTHHAAADRRPAWFPDSSAIAFHSDREGEAIWKVPRLGGEPAMLVANADDPAISPDGRRIAYSTSDSGGDPRIAVAQLDEPGGERVLSDARQGVWSHRNPSWSPDGREIVFANFRDLWIVSASGGEPRRLTSEGAGDFEPVFSPDGGFVYFSSYREGTQALWRVAAKGGRCERLTVGTGPESRPSLSADGARLAYTTFARDLDVELVDLASGESRRLPGEWREWGVTIAADASRLAYVSDRPGVSSLWLQLLASVEPLAAPRRVFEVPGIANPELSPDHRFVAFSRRIGGQHNVWVAPSGGGVPWALTEGAASRIQPSWSRDGRRIAWVETHPQGSELWLAPVAEGRLAGEPERFVGWPHALMWPRWSADDRSIAFLAAAGPGWDVWLAAVDGMFGPRPVTQGAQACNLRWDATRGDLVVSGRWGQGAISLRRVDPATGVSAPLAISVGFGPEAEYGQFDLSADGRLLGLTREQVRGDLWLLEAEDGSY